MTPGRCMVIPAFHTLDLVLTPPFWTTLRRSWPQRFFGWSRPDVGSGWGVKGRLSTGLTVETPKYVIYESLWMMNDHLRTSQIYIIQDGPLKMKIRKGPFKSSPPENVLHFCDQSLLTFWGLGWLPIHSPPGRCCRVRWSVIRRIQ